MSEATVTLIMDGAEVQAKMGQTVMEAADAAGIYIPRLCYHPDLPSVGHCRLCTVRINGRPQSACTFPVADGLVIETNTEELNAHRRALVEMMFVEGNHYCPACETSGNCELQAMAYRLGLMAMTLPYLRRKRELDATHKDVYLDRDRCILCGRCVRASALCDGKNVFGFEGRGVDKRVAVDSSDGLGDTALAQTDRAAALCPTGAIVVKREGFRVPVGKRKYDFAPIGSEIEHKQV